MKHAVFNFLFAMLMGACAGQGTGMVEAQELKRPNVLLICVDDLRPELNCFGVDYIHSPNIDGLAKSGVRFTRHYVQAPTCGASRYALLTGCYGGSNNGALFQRAGQIANGKEVPLSMPAWFRQRGFTTVSVGKVSHHPGGLGGPDWNDPTKPELPQAWDRNFGPAGKWKHPRGWMHGLADGEIRKKAGEMDVFQSKPGNDETYPDGESTNVALEQLDLLMADEKKPFFLAVGLLRPHLPFGAPAKYMDRYRNAELPPIAHPQKPSGKTTWHGSGEFMKYNRWGKNPNNDAQFATDVRRHYAACVSYADAQVGKLLERIESNSAVHENTIVVLWGDHGWHLGEHAIWGKHSLFEESLRSPLIIRLPKRLRPSLGSGRMGSASDNVVQTVDIFPTLCELLGVPKPAGVKGNGRSLVDAMKSKSMPEGNAVSYSGKAQTLRTSRFRLILHKTGEVELYDHQGNGETENVANTMPGVVRELKAKLAERLE